MGRTINPVEQALQVFIDIKEKIIDKIDKKKGENLGSKLRSRARQIPEMILELGLVPTISYCLARAGIDNVIKVVKVIRKDSKELIPELEKSGQEELAYALYIYVLLNYLSIVAKKINNVEIDLDELAERNNIEEVSNNIIKYIEELMKSNIKTLAHELLYPYMLQFKRLCEAIYKSERELGGR